MNKNALRFDSKQTNKGIFNFVNKKIKNKAF